MIDQLTYLSQNFGMTPEMLLVIGIGLGALITIFGFYSVFATRNVAADRIAMAAATNRQARQDRGLLRGPADDVGGFMKSFMPADGKELSELRRKLAQAGFSDEGAVRKFITLRIALGLILSCSFLALLSASRIPEFVQIFGIAEKVSHLSTLQIFQITSVLVAVGYFGPSKWLSMRVTERQNRIKEAFPNALDLMQISVEAGLGFDAAMTRVGNELVHVSPEIAFEFLSVQRQVQAGRAREVAMKDMATRTGVEIVGSFANVVKQSMQFGTSMAEALTTYADEMRNYREMQAQEMANKLPVKMSAVLASLMLPALILLTVGPVVIRYTRYFGG